MNEDISVLQELVNRIHPITDEAIAEFSTMWTGFEVGRKEMITVAGNIEKYIYVVLEGVQRVYYHDQQDREATILFTYPPSFGGVLDSFLLQSPSRFNCESLTPSRFLRTSYADFSSIIQKHHSLETMVRKGLTGDCRIGRAVGGDPVLFLGGQVPLAFKKEPAYPAARSPQVYCELPGHRSN